MFIESPRFPDRIQYGAIGGPQFSTEIVVVKSGAEVRNQSRSRANHRWDVGQCVQKMDKFEDVRKFFLIAAGRANGFRFKDHADFKTSFQDGIAGQGNGSPTGYQLQKKYALANNVYVRVINKPVTGTISIKRAGVDVVLGSGAGEAAIDYATGKISFTADGSDTITAVTVGATTQVTLATNLNLTANQHMYITGMTGADADLLNDKAFKINSVTGSGPYVFTLDVDTTGKTITRDSNSEGSKYPQLSEAITWAGEFDVPCRFGVDEMRGEIVGPNLIRWDSIPIEEIIP